MALLLDLDQSLWKFRRSEASGCKRHLVQLGGSIVETTGSFMGISWSNHVTRATPIFYQISPPNKSMFKTWKSWVILMGNHGILWYYMILQDPMGDITDITHEFSYSFGESHSCFPCDDLPKNWSCVDAWPSSSYSYENNSKWRMYRLFVVI